MMPTPSSPLDQGALHRRFWRLALLNIAGSAVIPMSGMVDTALLGRLDSVHHLAGVSLASVVFDYLYFGFGFLRMSTTGLTAQAVGRRAHDEEMIALLRPLMLGLGAGILILALQRMIELGGLTLLGAKHSVREAAQDYIRHRIIGAPATLMNLAWMGWFLGRGQSGLVLGTTLFAHGVNILLSWIFVFHLHWAAAGAGLATAISDIASTLLYVAVAFAQGMRPSRTMLQQASRWRAMGSLMRLNRDLFLRTFVLLTVIAAFTRWSNALGTSVLVANALLLRYIGLSAYTLDGIANSVETLTGQCRGAGSVLAEQAVLRLSLRASIPLGIILGTALWLARRPLLALLTTHEEEITYAAEHAIWLLPFMVAGALAWTMDGYFLGRTDGRTLRNNMALSACAFFPVGALSLALRNNHLLWLAFTLFVTMRALTLTLAARRLTRPRARRTKH